MALFARRSLQRMLDELDGRIAIEAKQKLVHELNRKSASALGYEWELALLYALNTVGDVAYEAAGAQGGRRPDINFKEANEGPVRFVADVATVSDEGLERENPALRFGQSLFRLKQKSELKGSTHYEISGEATGNNFRDRKMRLKLPPASEIDAFLKARVEPWFRRIREERLERDSLAFDESGVQFSISYDEHKRYGSAHYPSYKATYSKTRNPVFSALKSKKRQLKESGTDLPTGIVLCDGGCVLLSDNQRGATAITVQEVVSDFLRQNTSVSFVVILVFPPARPTPFSGIVKQLSFVASVYGNPRAAKPISERWLVDLFNRGFARLPKLVSTPTDALHHIVHAGRLEGKPLETIQYGGGMMTSSVKISARMVQELLAGRITANALFDNFGRPGERFENPFEQALRSGLSMDSIDLTRLSDVDDDVLEIRFGLPDPAIGKISARKP